MAFANGHSVVKAITKKSIEGSHDKNRAVGWFIYWTNETYSAAIAGKDDFKRGTECNTESYIPCVLCVNGSCENTLPECGLL